MTMEVVNCFYEEKKNAEYLERQIEECPVREKRFIKRGIEYLYLKNVYDVTEIEDSLIDSYALWLQEHGIKDRKLIGVYQKSLYRTKENRYRLLCVPKFQRRTIFVNTLLA